MGFFGSLFWCVCVGMPHRAPGHQGRWPDRRVECAPDNQRADRRCHRLRPCAHTMQPISLCPSPLQHELFRTLCTASLRDPPGQASHTCAACGTARTRRPRAARTCWFTTWAAGLSTCGGPAPHCAAVFLQATTSAASDTTVRAGHAARNRGRGVRSQGHGRRHPSGRRGLHQRCARYARRAPSGLCGWCGGVLC